MKFRNRDKGILSIALVLYLAGTVCAALTGLTATEGLSIDLSSAGVGTDMTIAFDPTELLGSRTFGDASTDTIVWTWNRATGTDPTITFGNGTLGTNGSWTIAQNLTVGTGAGESISIGAANTAVHSAQTSALQLGAQTFLHNVADTSTSLAQNAYYGSGGWTYVTNDDVAILDIADGVFNFFTLVPGTGSFALSDPKVSISALGLITTTIGLDGAGAVDLDYGSADITDHTFVSDGGTVILDGSVTAAALSVFNAGLEAKNGATAAGFISIYEDSDDGAHSTKIQVVAQAGDITYSLPPDDGDNTEVLQTDGSGVLTWVAAGAGDITSVWDTASGAVTQPVISSGEFLDGGTATSDAAGEGILLPRANDVSAATAEGQISWDADDDLLYVGDGVGVVSIAGSFDSTAVDDTTWSDNANASNQWTFNVSGTDHTMIAGDNSMTFSGNVGVGGTPNTFTHLKVVDETLDTTSASYGMRVLHDKTAGVTDNTDIMVAIQGRFTMAQAGGTVGNMYGVIGDTRIALGTVGVSIYGTRSQVDGDGGTVTSDVFGSWINVDLEAAMTSIGGDVFGSYIIVDADEDPSGTAYMLYLDEATNIDYGIYQNGTAPNYFGGDVGIGTATIPHGGVGWAKFAIDGTNASSAGPHIQFTTASDNYPLLQILPYSHDDISIRFDSYWDGSNKSSDAGSNYAIFKVSDSFKIMYDSGVAKGAAVAWNDGIVLNTSGLVTILDITVSGGNINTGNIPFTIGDGTTDSITLSTDGTGTAEIALPAGSIDGTEILDDTIDSADYAAASIDNEHLADDAVDSAELATDAVGVDALDQTISPTLTGRWTFAGEDTGTDVIGLNVNWAGTDPVNGQTEGDLWYDSTLNVYKGYTTHEIILGSAEEPGIIQAKKGSAGTISAGDAVYITGFDGTDLLVELADADDSSKMPAIGIAEATINSGTAGSVTTFGLLEDIINTGAMAVGDGIWITVTGTTGNTLTNTKPTGATTAIQRIATVVSVAASGELFVAGALRTNDLPNLTEAYIFVGNASNYATAVAMGGDVAIIADGTTTIADSVTVTGWALGTSSATTLTVTNNIKDEPKHMIFNIFNPLGVQGDDTQVCIWPSTPAAITITNIKITLDAAGNEIAGDLKFADTFIGLGTPTVINVCDTTSGVIDDSAMADGTVPSGKAIYYQFDSAPNAAITQMSWDITFDYD